MTVDAGNDEFRVLDAGCGMQTRVELPSNAHVVGIDISEAALSQNASADELVLGDIETYSFRPESFDLVVCHDVLEHLENPVTALRNLAGAVKPGGEIDVMIPILWSLKGIVTKITPHRFHVWCYRRIFKIETAGQEGFAPFPTKLRITPRVVERELARAGFETVSVRTWRTGVHMPQAIRALWDLSRRLEALVLPGGGATDYQGRFRKTRRETPAPA